MGNNIYDGNVILLVRVLTRHDDELRIDAADGIS